MSAQRSDFSDQPQSLDGARVDRSTDGSPTVTSTGAAATPPDGAAFDDVPTHDLTSAHSTLGNYKLLAELARGGMGVVYKAQDPAGKIVALKTIRLDRGASSEYALRFAREVQAAQHLTHPNIVPIYDVGEGGGCQFFTMELVPQGSLSQHRARFQNDARAAPYLNAGSSYILEANAGTATDTIVITIIQQ